MLRIVRRDTSAPRRLAHDRSGATAIEYGLIAAGISVAIINVLQSIGANLKETWALLESVVK